MPKILKFDEAARRGLEAGVNKMLEHIDDWRDAPVWDAASIELATIGWFAHLGRDNETVSGDNLTYAGLPRE